MRDAVRAAVGGMDVVYHTAAVPGVWGSWELFYSINVRGTENVIEACQAAGVRKLIFTSSPSVTFDGRDQCGVDETAPYPQRWLCHYPHTKALAEQAVLAANGRRGLLTCALRPHLIWGPRDGHLVPRLIDRARRGRLRQVGDGTNLVDMVYVENAAHAHLLAADALADQLAGGGPRVFHQSRGAGPVLGLDQRDLGAGRPPPSPPEDLGRSRVARGGGARIDVPTAADRAGAGHDPLSGGAARHIALLQHRPRTPGFSLSAVSFDRRGYAASGPVAQRAERSGSALLNRRDLSHLTWDHSADVETAALDGKTSAERRFRPQCSAAWCFKRGRRFSKAHRWRMIIR